MRYPLAKIRLVFSFIVLLASCALAGAQTKQRVVFIALDKSKSMHGNDREGLRGEAAGLLAAILEPADQVGVIFFGGEAVPATPVERRHFDFHTLENVPTTDDYTAFAPVVQIVDQYLQSQPSQFFASHEVTLVLLTDGGSDPGPGDRTALAKGDWDKAYELVKKNADHLKVYTIGLGEVKDEDRTNLRDLGEENSFYPAKTASDLPGAFLKIAAHVAGLPIYSHSGPGESSSELKWEGYPRHALAIFVGAGADAVQIDGSNIFKSRHIVAAELKPSAKQAMVSGAGGGELFLGIQEPLKFIPNEPFPAAMLTDDPQAVTFHVQSEHGPLRNAFFLQGAEAHLEMAGVSDSRQSLTNQHDGTFAGTFRAQADGAHRIIGHVVSAFGGVDSFVGDLTTAEIPAILPKQVEVNFYDPLPRAWFAKHVPVEALLPVGTVTMHLDPQQERNDQYPRDLDIAPGRPADLAIIVRGRPGNRDIKYFATWSDANASPEPRILYVVARQMSLGELLAAKWPWIVACLAVCLGLVMQIYRQWPRPIRAVVTIRLNGSTVVQMRLPSERRTGTLHLRESDGPGSSSSDSVSVAGSRARDLISLRSARQRGRWTVLASPQAARVNVSKTRKARAADISQTSSEIDIRSVHIPYFVTEDGTIQVSIVSTQK